MENFGWNFSANIYSEPATIVLSSSAMVTAAEKVQEDEMRQIMRCTKIFDLCKKSTGVICRARSVKCRIVSAHDLLTTIFQVRASQKALPGNIDPGYDPC